ncbi:hypothetical protein BSLA_02r1977 [Burkholderia stabilis]|nr:hypothetical protein BSLA_02r1977 [Burkholderia stabilis]
MNGAVSGTKRAWVDLHQKRHAHRMRHSRSIRRRGRSLAHAR